MRFLQQNGQWICIEDCVATLPAVDPVPAVATYIDQSSPVFLGTILQAIALVAAPFYDKNKTVYAFEAVPQAATAAAPNLAGKVITALKPLTDFMGAAAYPICYLGIGCGFIMIMLGQKQKGMQIIKSAAIGFVGMQFLPAIMAILVEVAQAMQAG